MSSEPEFSPEWVKEMIQPPFKIFNCEVCGYKGETIEVQMSPDPESSLGYVCQACYDRQWRQNAREILELPVGQVVPFSAPILTMQQPWASCIAYIQDPDGKRCENRGKNTEHRGPVFIHAGQSQKSFEVFPPLRTLPDGRQLNPGENDEWKTLEGRICQGIFELQDFLEIPPNHKSILYPTGCIIAVADLYDVVSKDPGSEWWMGPVGWLLRDVRPIRPIPYRGTQGLQYRNPITVEIEVLR